MASANLFRRRVTAREDLSSDNDDSTAAESTPSSVSLLAAKDDAGVETHSEGAQTSSDDDESSDDRYLSTVSFGALAKAQEALTKHGQPERGNLEDSSTTVLPPWHHDSKTTEATERQAGKKDRRDFPRSSKHAPTKLSSKKAVSRKREIVPVQKRDIRDPRFESVTGPLDEQKTKKNYAFLDEYRDSEMSALKSAIRATRNMEAKEKLKRALVSMESRKKAQQAKEQQQEVLRAHRSKEKELIQQGKKPFYLKKGEQKKLALVKRFEGMKGKQVDRAIERRRKKQARRERKEIPEGRRGV